MKQGRHARVMPARNSRPPFFANFTGKTHVLVHGNVREKDFCARAMHRASALLSASSRTLRTSLRRRGNDALRTRASEGAMDAQ
jgi:hypothetical protein